jgi:hypothetical protein
MKLIKSLFSISFLFWMSITSAQSLELSGTFTSSDARFYKNTPGLSLAYSHHLKKQFIFIEVRASQKKQNSYSEISRYLWTDTYDIKLFEGDFYHASARLGIAQKLITSEYFDFSIGLVTGLNYYKNDNEVRYLGFDTRLIGSVADGHETDIRIGRFGYGAIIDMELKRILIDNLSLFARLDLYQSSYTPGPYPRGGDGVTSTINSICFGIGLKYRFNVSNTNP